MLSGSRPAPQRELRELTRYRTALLHEQPAEVDRLYGA